MKKTIILTSLIFTLGGSLFAGNIIVVRGSGCARYVQPVRVVTVESVPSVVVQQTPMQQVVVQQQVQPNVIVQEAPVVVQEVPTQIVVSDCRPAPIVVRENSYASFAYSTAELIRAITPIVSPHHCRPAHMQRPLPVKVMNAPHREMMPPKPRYTCKPQRFGGDRPRGNNNNFGRPPRR